MNPILTPSPLPSTALSAANAANAANAVKSDARADGAPAEQTVSTQAEHHHRVGAHHGRMPRVARPPRPTPTPKKRSAAGANKPVHDDHDMDHAVVEALSRMTEGGEAGLEEFLNDFETLARHSLLREAISRSEDEGDEEQLRGLQAQMHKLESEHGPEIEQARVQGKQVATLLETVEAQASKDPAYAPSKLDDFLATFKGGRGPDRSSDAILRSMFEHLGVANVQQAMPAILNSKSRAPATRERAVGPRLWVSMGEMAKLFQINSCLAIGNDLHTKLTNAGVKPRHAGEGALALLNVADPRQGQPEQLVKQIVGKAPLAPQLSVKMYNFIREAVDNLPTTLWPRDKMSLRAELLTALRAECRSAPSGRLSAEQARSSARREQHLREELPANAPASPTPTTTIQEQ